MIKLTAEIINLIPDELYVKLKALESNAIYVSDPVLLYWMRYDLINDAFEKLRSDLKIYSEPDWLHDQDDPDFINCENLLSAILILPKKFSPPANLIKKKIRPLPIIFKKMETNIPVLYKELKKIESKNLNYDDLYFSRKTILNEWESKNDIRLYRNKEYLNTSIKKRLFEENELIDACKKRLTRWMD